MMKRIALFVVVLALACLSFKCEKSAATFNGAMSNKVVRTTPKGASVHSAKSISDAQISAVDAGLDRLFTIAQQPPNNYRPCPGPVPCFNDQAGYTIWLLPRAAACVNPGFTEVVYSDPGRTAMTRRTPTTLRTIGTKIQGLAQPCFVLLALWHSERDTAT
jgi:hypothetical protein